MKIRKLLLTGAVGVLTTSAFAQITRPELQYFRYNDQRGVNVFETPKENDVEFNGVAVRVGGDFAMQFQGLDHENAAANGDTLIELSSNFNLPAANLNLDVQLADGMRMHLRTYLSSKHHTEAYVKGGYLQVDKLDFIKEGFLSGFMELATIRIGMDEINYGDAHFRRSDNAGAIFNPFVGNYIMDAFTTEPFVEVMLRKNGLLGMIGFSNGRLNQSPTPGDDGIVVYGKLGYDKQLNEDLRVRITGSIYSSTSKGTRDYLYGGDRAGSRYNNILEEINGGGSDFSPRFNPAAAYQTSFQINPFVKWKGLEVFGIFEMNMGKYAEMESVTMPDVFYNNEANYTQIGAEVLYRFFEKENVYVGGRFNSVSGSMNLWDEGNQALEESLGSNQTRINFSAGWFMTKNVMLKLEYVMQNWGDGEAFLNEDGSNNANADDFSGTKYEAAKFNGLMLEAVIGF